MEKNKLPNFIIIWHEDKAALIDPEGKVCLQSYSGIECRA